MGFDRNMDFDLFNGHKQLKGDQAAGRSHIGRHASIYGRPFGDFGDIRKVVRDITPQPAKATCLMCSLSTAFIHVELLG